MSAKRSCGATVAPWRGKARQGVVKAEIGGLRSVLMEGETSTGAVGMCA